MDEIRAIVSHARALGPVEPPRDLWPGIAASLEARSRTAEGGTEVIALPTAHVGPAQPARRRGIVLSAAQLAAAAVALMFVSVSLTLSIGFGADAADPVPATAPGVVRAVSTGDDPGNPGLSDRVAALEDGLARAGERLSPNTVRIIQKNLAVIERAIEESRLALALDPENAFLKEHLDRAFERKRDYLEEAVLIVEWAS